MSDFKETKPCVAIKNAACTTAVGLSLLFGPPAAELLHEDKHGEQAAVMPRGAHEHPIEENQPNHIQILPITMSTTTSSSGGIIWPKQL